MAKSFFPMPLEVSERTDLTLGDKMVYGAMLGYQGRHHHCFASHEKIARRIGANRTTVDRAIGRLKAKNLIEPVMVESERRGKVIRFQQRGGDEGGRTYCWRCLILLPEKPKRGGLVALPKRITPRQIA